MNGRPVTAGDSRLARPRGSGAGGTLWMSRLIRPYALPPTAPGRSANDNYAAININAMGKCSDRRWGDVIDAGDQGDDVPRARIEPLSEGR